MKIKKITALIMMLLITASAVFVPFEAAADDKVNKTGFEKSFLQDAIIVSGGNFTEAQGFVKNEQYEGKTNVAVFTENNGFLKYEINIPQKAEYNIYFEYYALESKGNNIRFNMSINGKMLYEANSEVYLPRHWENAKDSWQTDSQGNQFASPQQEIKGYFVEALCDRGGAEKDCLKFELEAGINNILIESKEEPFVISKIVFEKNTKIISYEEYNKQNIANGYKNYSGKPIVIQAESADIKSEATLSAKADNGSAAVDPVAVDRELINYIGGTSWNKPFDELGWIVEVPESGLYKLDFFFKQSYILNNNVYRSLEIDGQPLFEEMTEVPFYYTSEWKAQTFGDKDNDYLIYLEKGNHLISMAVSVGENSDYFKRLSEIVRIIGDEYLKIVMITGETPDADRSYELFKQIPDLEEKFTYARDELNSLSDDMVNNSKGNTSQYSAAFKNMVRVLEDMLARKYMAHQYKDEYYSQYCSLSSWLYELCDMSLSLDKLVLSNPDDADQKIDVGFFKNIAYKFKKFIYSFSIDYNSISSSTGNKSIKLWLNIGRDQAQVLNTLIQERFTTQHNIDVTVELVNATVIQGLQTRNFPDVVIMMPRANPVNYAMRGVLVDLSKYPDFEQVLGNFNKGAEVPYRYNGGCYALPDTQNFDVMYYREDILNELGIEVPKTWDEYFAATAVLQRKNMQTCLPNVAGTTIFFSLLSQNGIDVYNKEQNATNLSSLDSISVFKYYTNIYTQYKVPMAQDFYNRFRIGLTPLGVAPYTTYATFAVGAPEIKGKWKLALVPGTVTEDGINNNVVGMGTGCGILAKSKKQDEAWEFLKWWVSDDTQYLYSKNIENVLGITGRNATSNKNAFMKYSWTEEELKVLLTQWESVVEVPEVPGSYYVSRAVHQAFLKTVNGTDPYDAMLNWDLSANKEIKRKIKEYSKK